MNNVKNDIIISLSAWNKIRNNFGDEVWNAVGNNVRDKVRNMISIEVWSKVFYKLNEQS